MLKVPLTRTFMLEPRVVAAWPAPQGSPSLRAAVHVAEFFEWLSIAYEESQSRSSVVVEFGHDCQGSSRRSNDRTVWRGNFAIADIFDSVWVGR